jgi:hypothetical protein
LNAFIFKFNTYTDLYLKPSEDIYQKIPIVGEVAARMPQNSSGEKVKFILSVSFGESIGNKARNSQF